MAQNWIPLSQKGQPDGVATLNGGGLVPDEQLPRTVVGQSFEMVTASAEPGVLYIMVSAPRFYAVSALVAAIAPNIGGAAWSIRGAVRTTPGGGIALVGTPIVEGLGADPGATGWTVELVAHYSGALHIVVTGADNTEVHWTSKTFLAEAR